MNSTFEEKGVEITATSVIMSLPMILVSLLGIFGNTIVWLAIYREKSLRTVSNMYVANLSLADFLVSVTCAPFSIIASMQGGQWEISDGLCRFWGTMNCVFCIASLFTLFAFSIYRYYAVTRLQHSPKLSQIAMASIVLIWFLSIAFTLPPVVGWGKMKFYPTHCVCTVDWIADQSYSVFLILAAFGAPLMVMMVFYYKMLKFIHSQNISVGVTPKSRAKTADGGECSKISVGDMADTKITDDALDEGNPRIELKCGIADQITNNEAVEADQIIPVVKKSLSPHKVQPLSTAEKLQKNKLEIRTNRERKLIKILVTTVAVYLLCWSPWSVDSLLLTFGVRGERPFPLERIELWLAYGNSCCNPIIYAVLNIQFRNAFKTILRPLLFCKR